MKVLIKGSQWVGGSEPKSQRLKILLLGNFHTLQLRHNPVSMGAPWNKCFDLPTNYILWDVLAGIVHRQGVMDSYNDRNCHTSFETTYNEFSATWTLKPFPSIRSIMADPTSSSNTNSEATAFIDGIPAGDVAAFGLTSHIDVPLACDRQNQRSTKMNLIVVRWENLIGRDIALHYMASPPKNVFIFK